LDLLAKMLVPSEILREFEVTKAFEENGVWVIELYEKADLAHIPRQIKFKAKAVLNGYCSPIDIQTFPTDGKEVFLRLYRRKWKVSGESKSYHNQYSFTEPGMKATKKFAAFLKEIN